MLCRKPFVKEGMAFGCGQCPPCRQKRRREWAHRIMMEASISTQNCFVTLTYDCERLPILWLPTSDCSVQESAVVRDHMGINGSLVKDPQTEERTVYIQRSTLAPVHMKNFLKRLRRKYEPLRFRFFGVGEYGSRTWRPHYHLILFNFPGCRNGITRYQVWDKKSWFDCCDVCRLVGETWGAGNVYLGTVTGASAMYVANYTVKNLTGSDDRRLRGRNPEFMRMSNRRGIGYDALWDVASVFMDKLEHKADVPHALRYAGIGHLPIARYLKRNLRKMVGRDEKAPQATLEVIKEGLRPMREAAFDASTRFADKIVEMTEGEYANFMGRLALRKGRD